MSIFLRKFFLITFLVATASVFSAYAAEETPSTESIFEDDYPEYERPGRRMPDEMVDRMMNHLQEKDPNTAEHLAKLRSENPEQFRKEFRKAMREHWQQIKPQGRQFGHGWHGQDMPGDDKFNEGGWPGRKKGPHEDGPGWDRMSKMRQKHEEFIEWLQKNYPQDANQLEYIRENNSELYMRKLMHSVRKYGRIAEAAKDSPELAEVLKKDLVLKDNRDEILKKIRTADSDQKEKLTKELTDIVSERFDLIIKRKQIQHEQLLQKLEKLKQQIKNSESEVDKWKESKKTKVNERVNELLSETEKFQWD